MFDRVLPGSGDSACTDHALIAALGDLADERVLLLGDTGADWMCALVRAGASEVSHLVCCERLEPERFSLALVPQLPSLGWLALALPAIRRALFATGRLVLCADAADITITAHRLRPLLVQSGYIPVRTSRIANHLVVEGERPMLSLRRVA